ncbi:endonuclease/exonuclease/phosphatase family protein [Aequorivita marina]|uniref:endonuclease/exonuclease/phosphatase family protein n=1 Tax=Aequorivita marina TaxID=3073654 RepID=UPI0028740167|nr:endonuclease/exonuclease/phosphatase family protein [Aequorivita sp. S2608]MDS1296851.1 endonuclease/exonuclease/phosphatase family protein [Aequorivita sp. S2608]
MINSFKIIGFSLLFALNSLSCNTNFWQDKTGEVSERVSKKSFPEFEVSGTSFSDTLKISKNTSLRLASWNIQHLGRTKTPEDIYEIANTLRHFDIVAVQEVVAKDPAGAQAVAKIADELNRMGFKWDYQISDPTKSPSVYISERYAFLWKTAKVSIVNRAYLDSDLEKLCYREPFIAAFKKKGKSEPFYVVNYHSRKYNDRPEEEIIHFLNYRERLESNRILIAGDFNLSEKHAVWEPFYRRGFKSALQNQRTTLKRKCKNGEYLSHPIDNVYFSSGIKMVQAQSVDFMRTCKNLKRAREISDHLPVYIEFKIGDNEN